MAASQFTSLRSFVPHFACHGRHRRCTPAPDTRQGVKTYASNAAELLRSAQQLHIPRELVLEPSETSHLADLEGVAPYHDWHQHVDLLQGCEPGSPRPLRVAVLLSGGVDSSLALHLLKAAGHKVTAFYLQIWFQEDFKNFWDACPWEEDLAYCQQVCQQLGVLLEVVPLTEQYWDRVVSHCIGEIRQGRTPNPDMLCNSRVKFGAFYEYLEHNYGSAFDRVASGHYARLEQPPASQRAVPEEACSQNSSSTGVSIHSTLAGGKSAGNSANNSSSSSSDGSSSSSLSDDESMPPVRLALTPDAVKDQTYFLAHLSQRQLARTMFPLGHLTKAQVRRLAAAAELPNKGRKDSQGICFLGKVKFSEFVKEHLGEWPGPFIEEETREVVGYHKGFWFHTLGQRKGVPLSGGPWYVTRKDPETNAVYLSRQYHDQDKVRNAFTCGSFNWIGGGPPAEGGGQVHCKVRHGPHMYPCSLQVEESGERGWVQLDGNDQGLAAGQYAVFYQGGYCLGSAVITGSSTKIEARSGSSSEASPAELEEGSRC